MLQARAARAIVVVPQRDKILVFNFLAKSAFTCSPELIKLLAGLDEWKTQAEIAALLPDRTSQSVRRELDRLIALHAVVAKNSAYAEIEDGFVRSWEWGIPSALLHFSLRDNICLTDEEAVRRQLVRAKHDPSPELYLSHGAHSHGVALSLAAGDGLLSLMAKRRTNRLPGATHIDESHLADCLHAGLGITGEVLTETGRLPLSMTPSGGARNPYEAYVLVRWVKGLEPGFYHYAAAEHSLHRIDTDDAVDPSSLLGGQAWTDAMPCVIILIAHFERTMWKYSDPNGYRVVLIEAGHIGQNIMLAATARGLTACPTAALCHSRIESILGLGAPTRAAVYALTLSFPGPDDSTVIPLAAPAMRRPDSAIGSAERSSAASASWARGDPPPSSRA